ncbi:MAG: MFS transporter, partial [Pseudomonadota bacterium]
MSAYRNVSIHIFAVALLQLCGGILGIAAPLGLEALGLDNAEIGVVAALFAAGFMAGAWSAPQAILAFGNIRVFAAASALLAAGSLLMFLAPHWAAWSGIRLVQGLAFAWMFASLESWLSAATPADSRGGVLGLYHVVAKAALLTGPFLLVAPAPLSAQPYVWAAVFAVLALVPVCLTRSGEPQRHGNRAMGPVTMLKLAPAALSAAFFAGMINSGVLALLPVYAQETLTTTDAASGAALAMAAAWLGGLISQWPAGRISDRVDRRTVIAGMGLVALLATSALA